MHWPPAPENIDLDLKHVHIWAAALTDFHDQVTKLWVWLSSVEQARAERFRFVEDRNRFVIRRGLARLILSRYLNQPPVAIEYQFGEHGKPEVRKTGAGTPLFLNTSHSAEIAICAVASACPIGVDVERTREIPEIEQIGRHFFLAGETQKMMAQPLDSRMDAFYACWTRKEAFLKATGEGIAESLAKVEVTLTPEEKPEVVSVSGDQRAREQWQLQPFVPAHGYVGCVVYKNAVLELKKWRVTNSTI
jgi:4'-phosphopantetheinyl transferase